MSLAGQVTPAEEGLDFEEGVGSGLFFEFEGGVADEAGIAVDVEDLMEC